MLSANCFKVRSDSPPLQHGPTDDFESDAYAFQVGTFFGGEGKPGTIKWVTTPGRGPMIGGLAFLLNSTCQKEDDVLFYSKGRVFQRHRKRECTL